MANFRFNKLPANEFAAAKRNHLRQLPAPLDGMWESFIDRADHYSIRLNADVLGYCAINSDRKLLQYCVLDNRVSLDSFRHALNQLNVTGAFVATVDSPFLVLCLDHQKSVTVNALMYRLAQGVQPRHAVFPEHCCFRQVEGRELPLAIGFGIETLNADPDWISGYFAKRIKKGELLGLWQGNSLIATGECRPSRTQHPYADLGMVVSKQHRAKGIATNILRALLGHCRERGLRAICSTGRDNIGAQKAISNSGFVSDHRILEIEF